MSDNIKLNISDLEIEKNEIIRVYKKQLETCYQIKKSFERISWDDERYDKCIESINLIFKSLLNALNTLTNGDDLYIIDDLICFAKKYMDNGKKFP